ELLSLLKEDAKLLAAENVYELERCWENTHRMFQAEAHVRTILFRDETRWPGYYFRSDTPKMDNDNWVAFANITYDSKTGDWTPRKVPVTALID
ncbi:MAG: adenylylsulfate reductase subunit alpha, partial [Thermodesulfobacteriota bacterium]|nr:adenylylsulfate reductase subunit alpha [Thermodesulfobacteriota bacterium]